MLILTPAVQWELACLNFCLNFAAEMGSNPALYIPFFWTQEAGKFEMQMAVSNGQKAHHTISGNVLFQIRQILKTVVQNSSLQIL